MHETHLGELYQAVWENPDDDATKLVLADALLAAGDPRGELIQLQFSSKHDESGAMKLLQRFGITWLGALRGKVIPIAYEKGFLASCSVIDAAGAAGCPEWSTVHSVKLDVEDLALLDDPALRSLRAVIDAEPSVVAALVKRPVARRLTLITAMQPRSLARHHTALAALPRLAAAVAPRFRLSRAPDGKLSHMTLHWWRDLAVVLVPMPPDAIATATIYGVPRSERESLEAHLARFPSIAADIQHGPPEEDLYHERRER